MSKVFITRPIPEEGITMLKEKGYDIVINEAAVDRAATKEELIEGVKGADALLSVLTEKIDGEIMDAGLPSLKIIANYAVGYDNIDLDAAKHKKLMVSNTPGVLTNTVAEHTFALLLAVARRIPEGDRFVRSGSYTAWGPELLLGADINSKTLGVVGLGRIGTRVAHHAINGFGMTVVYTDRDPNPEFETEHGAEFFSNVEEMLPKCDFLTIHLPLLDTTRHYMNAKRFGLMKSTASLINTSRGPVVEETALIEALKKGTIRSAALDVFEFEPKVSEELSSLDNVILTPHIASATEETRAKMSELAAQNIIAAIEGDPPPNLIKMH